MSLKIGIVGLPNVGKSTLFNALTKSKQADAQNYPFCTIDPNVGVVEVPDIRLKQLSDVSNSAKIIPTTIEFVDIAGLVKGAADGEGLGNKFLAHIREVDAIAQVVRLFSDTNVTHVHNSIDPVHDLEIINTELALADLETVAKQCEKLIKESRSGKDKLLDKKIEVAKKLSDLLGQGRSARELEITDEDQLAYVKSLQLVTRKPMMIIANTDEQGSSLPDFGIPVANIVKVSAKLEAELAEMPDEEAKEYLKELGIEEQGLDKIINSGYELLNLITYLTSGELETRAWTVRQGATAPQAAGVIHTDFEKGFIRAEVANWKEFVELGGWSGCKEKGKMRVEGKDYVVQDGDVCFFRVA